MCDVPVDLCRLSQLHGLYAVFDVTNALQEQLGEDDPDANCKLLVTTTTGNPIKDMVTTRGKVFAGALPKETHCSCRNKRNNRGIILPPKKCVYAEYCSKKNIGSLPDAKNLRYHMEVICHCRYFSINQAFTCDLKKGFSCVIHKELRRIETLRVEFCKNRLWYLKSDNEDDSDDFDFTPKPIQTRSITFTVEPGLCRTAHSQRTAATLDQILAKLKGWREKKRCKKNLKMCDFPLCREDLKCDRTEPCYSRTS